MADNARIPADTKIKERLGEPLVSSPDGAFKVGLVLNGTVSAGAWTAGVMDFLFEALDRWEEQKRVDKQTGREPTVPDHAVSIGVAGGASGGGVCAALLARAANWAFAPVTDPADPANQDNPFWRVWVEQLDIEGMLGTADLRAAGAIPQSLLSGAAIEGAGQAILDWPGSNAQPKRRPWLGDPLRVYLTLTNLRGVPYRIKLESGAGGLPHATYYVDHADHALFAFSTSGRGRAAFENLRGDEHFVADEAEWREFAEFAKATGAFPVGFPPRRLKLPVSDYAWRGVALPPEVGDKPDIRLRKPAWDALDPPIKLDDDYHFECVDGGALNNQPMELVRTALAGLGKSNPRDAAKANAAVLLLDPFAAVPRCEPPTKTRDLLGVLGGVASAWIDHGRFATSDLLLSVDEDVFSRFLLTASDQRQGKQLEGSGALATAGLGAFLGFLCRAFRVRDFMLGRENCRIFLRDEFVLRRENPLLREFATNHAEVANRYQANGSTLDWLPVIPLVEPLRKEKPVPAWPVGALDPGKLLRGIEGRTGLLLRRLIDYHHVDFPLERVLIDWLVDHKLAQAAEQQIRKGLADQKLG